MPPHARDAFTMLDWDDLRFFLSIARHKNLVAAAKELRVAQSTVGRRLASLESSLGVRLLNRTPEGYVATLAGERVLHEAERFETGSLALERDVGGRDTQLAGSSASAAQKASRATSSRPSWPASTRHIRT